MTEFEKRAKGLKWFFKLYFEPRDLWIGLYWDVKNWTTHYYICLIPTLVIHLYRGIKF